MFFRRKKWLRSEFDEKLLEQLNRLKTDWNNQKSLVEKALIHPLRQLARQSWPKRNTFSIQGS